MTIRSGLIFSVNLAGVLAAGLSRSSVAQQDASGTVRDPVVSDPTAVDTLYPPATKELAFSSQGSRLNGFFYLAQGKGPHPTVILLHGFPGSERNLDLAQALRRAGMNVLFFDYRGSWGSGGTFSFANALDDVASAVRFVRDDSSVTAYRINPSRLVLIGHSMGGWLSLLGSARDSSLSCAVALDFWNVGADGVRMRRDKQFDSLARADIDNLTGAGGPIRAESGPALATEMKAHGDEWNAERWAPQLSSRTLLLISATQNEAHRPLTAALDAAHAPRLTALQWKTDHGFSDRRIKLAQVVLHWIRQRCG
jgi:pimeloyl-ACP methyl ester carboxylesterase